MHQTMIHKLLLLKLIQVNANYLMATPILQHKCVAHVVNLVVKNGLGLLKEPIEKVRTFELCFIEN
jgi:hypothetical protein